MFLPPGLVTTWIHLKFGALNFFSELVLHAPFFGASPKFLQPRCKKKDNSFCGVGTWLPKRPTEPNFSSSGKNEVAAENFLDGKLMGLMVKS